MHIKITERLRPFSHTPGMYCILPGSSLRLQIFPALLVVHDLSEAEPQLMAEIPVPVKGPVKEFTIQLDLEKSALHVWGESDQGYFRYQIRSAPQPFHMLLESDKGLSSWSPNPSFNHASFQVQKISSQPKNYSPALIDRLSLGSHKSQDWDMVKRRGELVEILPAWLRLGQLIKVPDNISYEGTAALLKVCQNASKLEAYEAFQNLFNVAFEGVLSPSLKDNQHQGFELALPPSSLSPLILLTEGAKAIRSLFIRAHKNEIFVLPCLPPQFHCGRFLQVRCDHLGLLDVEWTKKAIRCMVFHAETTESIHFHFPKDVLRFRLNGQSYPAGKPIDVEKGQLYTFDRFQA